MSTTAESLSPQEDLPPSQSSPFSIASWLKGSQPLRTEHLPPPRHQTHQKRHRSHRIASPPPASPAPRSQPVPAWWGLKTTTRHQIDQEKNMPSQPPPPPRASERISSRRKHNGGMPPQLYPPPFPQQPPRCALRAEARRDAVYYLCLLSQPHHPLTSPTAAMCGHPALGSSSSRISLASQFGPSQKGSPQFLQPKREGGPGKGSCLFCFFRPIQPQPTTRLGQQAQRPLSGWRLRAAGFHRAVPRRASQSMACFPAERHASGTRREGHLTPCLSLSLSGLSLFERTWGERDV